MVNPRQTHHRILLTGAAGGLGTALRSRLLANCEVLRLSDKTGLGEAQAGEEIALADLQACEWCEADFYALAMQASERFQREQQTLSLFTYDLHDYKQVPDWLNAKFWANPQHFGKYWW